MAEYSLGPYNKFNDSEQWIRITEGCPHNCPFCYEPVEQKVFGIPKIVRNQVSIMDMNLLSKAEALQIIKELGEMRVNEKVVYYNLICGVDFRFLTAGIAAALKASRFKKIRLAWDWLYVDQLKIKDAIVLLKNAGYRRRDLMVFVLCNWKIPYVDCCLKLDLCKVWNVQVADTYYDNQTSPNIEPVEWSLEEIKAFRKKCRKHNQLVNFHVDPAVCKGSRG